MYIMAALLVVGFLCNFFIRPVHEKHHMTEEGLDEEPTVPAMPATAASP
jgi:hypothetical protein